MSLPLKSKEEDAMVSPSDTDDPPPTYTQEFRAAGIEEDKLAILKNYDTVIIVDDSGSMTWENRWEQACDALVKLADVAGKYDTDGIEIRFLNEGVNHKIKSGKDVEDHFSRITLNPENRTPLGGCLKDVTNEHLKALESIASSASSIHWPWKGKGSKKPPKKANYLVITDGAPTDDLEEAIVKIAKRLGKVNAPTSQLGIQFIQVGTNPSATRSLQQLDNNLKDKYKIRDMVDTEPYSPGELTAARLAKLLLGGINRLVDKSDNRGGS